MTFDPTGKFTSKLLPKTFSKAPISSSSDLPTEIL